MSTTPALDPADRPGTSIPAKVISAAYGSVAAERIERLEYHEAPRAVYWPVLVGQVPGLASAFQARTGLRDRVEAARVRGGSVVSTQVLSGGGGVGKSQLAASYAIDAIRARTDLVVWAAATQTGAVIQALAQAAARVRASGADGANAETDARAFLAWAAATSRSWLVVLDDVADPGQLTGWWPTSHTGTGSVLATTRRRDAVLTGAGRAMVEVDVYTQDESHAYLTDRLTTAGRTYLLDEKAGALAEELGHLPLALSHATAYMIDEHISCAVYLDRYSASRERLDALMPRSADTDGYGHTVAATLLLALDAADACDPPGLARPAIRLAGVLDPAGHPETLWATEPVISYLTQNRTELAGPVAAQPSPGSGLEPVTAAQARQAVLLLHRYGLATLDDLAGPRAVRVHALTARAARELPTLGDLQATARAAADALMEVWPERDAKTVIAQALRDCTATLRGHSEQALWSPDAHPVLFRCAHSVGNVGLVRQAATYWEDLVAVCGQNLGPDHPLTLDAQRNLASWRGSSGDALGAVQDLEDLLTDCQRLLGSDHPLTLDTRVSLASWLGEAMDATGSVHALEELLAEQLRLLARDRQEILKTRHQLAYWLGYSGDTAGSIRAFEELLPDCQRILGPDDPETLSIRADLGFRRGIAGNAPGAARAFEELLPDTLRIYGPDHPATLNTRGNLARWKGDAGDPLGAVRSFEELLTDSVRILGPDHQHVLNTKSDLAHYRGMAGDAVGAAQALQELVPAYLRVLGPDHSETFTNRDRLAHWLRMAGYAASAASAYEELLADRLRILGSEHPDTLGTQRNLAVSYRQAGRTADAITVWERVAAEMVRILGPEHPDTVAVVNALRESKRRP